MISSGMIKPAASEWSAPIVLVKKKDGSLRLCVAYTGNSTKCPWVMPIQCPWRIDDLIDCVGKSPYILTLDLTRVIGRSLLLRRTIPRQLFPLHLDSTNLTQCRLDWRGHLLLFRDWWTVPSIWSRFCCKGRYCSDGHGRGMSQPGQRGVLCTCHHVKVQRLGCKVQRSGPESVQVRKECSNNIQLQPPPPLTRTSTARCSNHHNLH